MSTAFEAWPSLRELADSVRAGEVTAVSLAETALSRIEATGFNPASGDVRLEEYVRALG